MASVAERLGAGPDDRFLIINCADLGFCHAASTGVYDAVRHGLVGVSNFADAKGNAIKFETQKAVVNGRPYDVVSDTVMNHLGIVLIQELGREIKRISEVSAAEEKN